MNDPVHVHTVRALINTLLIPWDSVDADIGEATTFYLSDTVDEDGRSSWDGVGAK